MGILLEQIIARANTRTDFQNDELESIWKESQARDIRLSGAVYAFESACLAAGIDPIATSKSFLGLAQEFADILPAPNAERKARIVSFVNELIDDEEGKPALEAVSESLFAAAFDWETGLTETIAKANALIDGLTEDEV
jgi:hypothetical protein